MTDISRRKVIGTVLAGSVGLILTNTPGAEAAGQTAGAGQSARAFRGQHQPEPLAFNPAKLNGLSEKLIKSHWENNYCGAVKALNVVEQRLDATLREKDLPAYLYGDLKREELVRTGSVVPHEYYFDNLGGDGKAGGKALDLLKQWFGSYEQWDAEFKKAATRQSQRFNS